MTRPVVPLPIAAYAHRIVDSMAMRPGTEAYLEVMLRGVADQEELIHRLQEHERKGEPLPLHLIECVRFASEKNSGLCKHLLTSALNSARRPIAEKVRA